MLKKISDIPFMDRTWYQAWFDHLAKPAGWSGPLFGPDVDGCYIPLAWVCKWKLRFACLVGNYGPIRDIGVFNNNALLPCVEHLEQSGVGVGLRLGPVSDQSANIAGLLDVLRDRGWHVVGEQLGSEWIIDWYQDGFENYLASLGKKKVSRIDYYNRRMKKYGDVKTVHYHNVDILEWVGILDELSLVESRAWVTKSGEPRFFGSENQAYWRELFGSDKVRQAIHVWMTYFNGKPASFLFALDGHYTRYLYANSFDESVEDHSTGSFLWKMAFLDAKERGLGRINLGLGNSGYKTAWGAEPASKMMNYICFPPTVLGRLFAGLFCMKSHMHEYIPFAAFRRWRVRLSMSLSKGSACCLLP